MNNEEAFLFSTFKEFLKCWKSGTNARVFIESVEGRAFVSFSAFLGLPEDVHFKPRQWKWNPSTGPRKKSANKMKRDNDRAARFQARKRKNEEEAASASKSVVTPEASASSYGNWDTFSIFKPKSPFKKMGATWEEGGH